MIKITALNKKYKTKKRKECHALNNINLTLPDKGLVFVLGKSGSGKSTLLNLIGGLDSITSGKIEVDGNDLSAFKEKDFCNYRNTHIGFIFQDYHLIDDLTVYENIVLSLNLRRIEDKELVKAALEKVDLAGYEDRYPTELSGGEQQRVAIARAIVKKPRIILADEPTGNLDTYTATSIIQLLKELSRDCLILIVSHNVNDANTYADRIIELSKGEIISDKSRNPEFADHVTLDGDRLVYPKDTYLSDDDVEFINDHSNKKMVIRTDKFITTPENNDKAKRIKIENKRLSLGKELNLSGKFLKNKALAISLSAFMVSVIMIIMALAQTIVNFDGSHIIADEMAKSNQGSILISKVVDEETKAQLNATYPVAIDINDIQSFYDAGYKGKIYPILNYSLIITTAGSSWGTYANRFNGPYIAEPFGTMIVDEDFLASKFDGVKYLAQAETQMPYGVIITDYVADSILAINGKYKNKTYDDIVGDYYSSQFTYSRAYINAIIKTGYKENYSELLDKVGNNINTSQLYENETFQQMLTEVYDRLGYCYTTNEDFVISLSESPYANYIPHYKLVFNDAIEYTTHSSPYGINSSWDSDYPDSDHHLKNNWMYSTEIPGIPEGARYMRVSFNDMIDDIYGIKTDVTVSECARLRFDDGELISKEIMNANSSDGTRGVFLNEIDGEICFRTDIGTGQNGWTRTLVSDYIEIPENGKITEFSSIAPTGNSLCAFYDENKNYIKSVKASIGEELPEKTIRMTVTKYNEAFGTRYTNADVDSFVPRKVKMAHYNYYDVHNSNPLFVEEVTIILMDSAHSRTFSLSEDLWELFLKDSYRVYSLYLDGTDGIGKALDVTGELNYEPQSVSVEGIHSMTRAVDVFVPIFELISIFLYIGVIFILMNFASKMINDKMHEIGILKALGTKNGSIGVVFGLQVGLIALLTCGLSTLGYYLFIDVANDILIESIHRIAPSWTLPDLQFLTFKPEIALMNCLLIFALAFVSLIFPMIKIKAIKPVKIIKAKE